MRLRLGPLPCDGARAWTADTLALFDVLDGEPGLPFALPAEALAEMRSIVQAMQRRAATGTSFVWECDTTMADLKALITYWLNIGKLSSETLERVGGHWSDDVGERFHRLLLDALLEHLDGIDPAYADRLRRGWDRPTTAVAVVDLRDEAAASVPRTA
jgi:hypothetical protein